jgi:hypothetical protein
MGIGSSIGDKGYLLGKLLNGNNKFLQQVITIACRDERQKYKAANQT